jgi:hypothetical protein
VVASFTQDTVTVLLGVGDGSFTSAGSSPAGDSPQSLGVGDFNEDGKQDVAVLEGAESVKLLLGAGNGSFTGGDSVDVGAHPQHLIAGDWNADGHLDVAVTAANANSMDLLLGDGNGLLLVNGVYACGGWPRGLDTGDFDGNGMPDIVTASSASDRVTVLLNQTGPWKALGFGLAGVAGVPLLIGTGSLAAGSPGTLTLSEAAPSAAALLFISHLALPVPFKCGTLVPVPWLVALPLTTDADGGIALGWAAWPAGLSGINLYWQCAVQDVGGACGVALSNVLLSEVP